jgi:restriction endonuclease S subunit
LEGLEVSEVMLSKFERTLRIDSEFYSKENLLIEDFIKKNKYSKLTELVKVSDGNHMSISEKFIDSGIPYYRGQDIHSFFIEGANPNCIDIDTFNLPVMKRSHLQKGDVLLSIVGTIGKLGLVTTDNKATCSCKLAILRPSKIIAEFLSVFLASKYGQNQIQKFKRGALQMGLILEDFDQLLVPFFNDTFQAQIETLIKNAHSKLEQSKSTYTQAETLLLDTLGLADFSPSTEKVNIKSFKDSFVAKGRLDAEYFYPAKESALDFLEAMPGQAVGDLFFSVRNLWQPEKAVADEKVRNYDLTDALSPFLDNTKELATKETISSTKKRLQTGDLVVSRLRSYLKEIAVVMEGNDAPMVGSTEFIVLRPKQKILSVESLLVYLRSTLPQLILKWSQDGSNHPRFDEKELLNLRIPDAILAHEKEVKGLVERATAARRQSHSLLEVAKRAVEIAIETNEQSATVYIKENS